MINVRFLIQMSNFEEKLNSLKRKKLTAKAIVEQQRNELCVLKSSLTLNERLEEIFRRFSNEEKNQCRSLSQDYANVE